MERLFCALLALYSLSLFVSIAGMELLSGLIALAAVVTFIRTALTTGLTQALYDLKVSPSGRPPWIEAAVAGYFFSVLAGSLLQNRVSWWTVAGDTRWVIFLFTGAYLLRRIPLTSWTRGLPLFAAFTIIAGLYGALEFFTGVELFRSRQVLLQSGNFWRATGFFSLSLTYGCLMAMAAALSLSLATTRDPSRIVTVYSVAAVSAIAGLFGSLTRGAWAGLAFASAFVAAIVLRRKVLLPLLLSVATLILVLAFNETLNQRFIRSFNFESASYTVRFSLWRAYWEIFKDHPFFGVGLGQAQSYVREYYALLGIQSDFVSHAHNVYIHLLASTGLIGLISYLSLSALFLSVAWRLWKVTPVSQWHVRGFAIGAFTALVAFHFAGLTESNFTDAEIAHAVAFIWANLAALSRRGSETAT